MNTLYNKLLMFTLDLMLSSLLLIRRAKKKLYLKEGGIFTEVLSKGSSYEFSSQRIR